MSGRRSEDWNQILCLRMALLLFHFLFATCVPNLWTFEQHSSGLRKFPLIGLKIPERLFALLQNFLWLHSLAFLFTTAFITIMQLPIECLISFYLFVWISLLLITISTFIISCFSTLQTQNKLLFCLQYFALFNLWINKCKILFNL